MNKIQKRRFIQLGLFLLGLTLATSLILYALKQNISVFLTPSELSTKHLPSDYRIRLGGLVKPGSVIQDPVHLTVNFIVTDFKQDIRVHYHGLLPDLFREGKGVVVEGMLASPTSFVATQVLAKHDENYMPQSVYQALHTGTPQKGLKKSC